ncbi:MAG: hypothetical protein OHK93_008565 [Ramalina farinacea]|uniref:Uncharacterized protein n=1 Tax=Ramalina farinacea TaxID=258253 RepID=A0AA43TYM1_9LECA|nr:hypothetical protein [Ramalina farinacea]
MDTVWGAADILHNISSYLTPADFLGFTNTSVYSLTGTRNKTYLELETVENAELKPSTRFLSIPQQPVLADNVGIISGIQCR